MSEWSEVVAGVAGGALVLVCESLKSKFVDHRDRNKIFEWLDSEFKKTGKYEHRTTRAISKAVSLTPDRVYYLCHTDVRINPALGEKDDLWNLSGEDQVKKKGLWG